MICQLTPSVPSKPVPIFHAHFSAHSKPLRFLCSGSLSNSRTFFTRFHERSFLEHYRNYRLPKATNSQEVERDSKPVNLNIVISGAPASGKGTQCEFITKKYDLVHIAAGDLLREEIEAETDNGKVAKKHMEEGELVPDNVVVMMVKDRLLQAEASRNGWLLDGYPRSSSQAAALQKLGFRPDIFILLEVPEEILVKRVIGRRLDPLTGRIYHLEYSPPETEEIASRLIQRFDDTEEKVKLRLRTHNQNVEAVLSLYEDIMVKVNGALSKQGVFHQIDSALEKKIAQKRASLVCQ